MALVFGFQFPINLSFIQENCATLNTDFKCSTFWRFCFITMISSSSDGQVRRAIASEVVDLGLISSSVKPRDQKLAFTASSLLYLTLSIKRTVVLLFAVVLNLRQFCRGFSFRFQFWRFKRKRSWFKLKFSGAVLHARSYSCSPRRSYAVKEELILFVFFSIERE